MTKVKIFRYCSTTNFSKDYFCQQYPYLGSTPDSASGDLFYDSDGSGDNEQVKIARLNSGLSLSSDDLLLI